MAALMGGGTFAVHQLRYLDAVAPVVISGLLLASAAAVGRIVRRAEEPVPRFRRLWAATSAALIAVYCTQESIEGVLSGRVPGMFAHGGWVTLPLAVLVGLAIALVMRGTAAATRLATARAPWRAPAASIPAQVVLPPWAPASTRAPARHLAARGPPVVA
jgi:hypothetical protein